MTSTSIDYSNSATWEYLRVIREHVVCPLESGGIGESCFATALLVFGAVDGLGKLTHPDDAAGARERFKSFLPRMGPAYASLQDELWNLRNSLAHSAINVACLMSKTDDACGEHLERDHGFVFVHTVRLLADFKSAINKLEAEFRTDSALLQRAESRLRWDEIDEPEWRGDGPKTTAPAGVRFVRER